MRTPTNHSAGHRLAYDDADSPSAMHADCEAAERNLGLDRLHRIAVAASAPPPSIRFADYPREVAKPQIEISEAAARLAGALHLHLD